MAQQAGDRMRDVETAEHATMLIVVANPDTVVTAAEGSFAFDTVLDELYVNVDGATDWHLYSFMAYGGISRLENGVATALGVGVPAQILVFDTNNPARNSTPDHTNDHITIDHSGDYLVTITATLETIGGAGMKAEVTAKANNGTVDLDPIHVDRDMTGGGGEAGSVSSVGIVALTAGWTIEAWIENESNNQNIIVEDIILSLVKIG